MTEASKAEPARRRYLLAAVLAVIAAFLIVEGGRLLSLGGSPYYPLAGLAVAASAWFALKGDDRAIWCYAAMLVGSLLWALWEAGSDVWGLQARLLAPLVLGLWVAAPWLARLGWKPLSAAALILAGGTIGAIWYSTLDDSPVMAAAPLAADGPGEWHHYGNDTGGSRYAPLSQINPTNVAKLEHAWTFHTGLTGGIGFNATPLMVGDSVYVCTAHNVIFAVDAETGKQRWTYDPKPRAPFHAACRGVGYHAQPGKPGACAQRILFGTTDARLMAVDALTGKPCEDFGDKGSVDLKRNMGEIWPGYYYPSSAPLVLGGKIILGALVIDGQFVGQPSGVIRAYDAVTGQLAWAWDMDHPDRKGEPPAGEIYARGTANAWGTLSGDDKLGLVYVPLGAATPDYWGAHRSPAAEKYGNSVVALDLRDGTPRWHFQLVHHDVWDYDVSAQPTLIDLKIGGQTVPALIQTNKRGQVFLLDRRTGKPLSRVEERAVPQGPAKGDWLSPTQPFSPDMPGFDNEVLTEARMWGATPLDQLWCRIKYKQARYEGPMTPPGEKPTINWPGYIGGVNWGGISIDPERQLMTVNWTRVGNYVRLVPRAEIADLKPTRDGAIAVGKPTPQIGTPYAIDIYAFMSPLFMPCTSPPFGKIAVVDLVTRKTRWEKPLGTSADSGPLGTRSMIPLPMGVPNVGGSLMTRGGLIFIAATQERAFRAFDSATGKRLWSVRLPAGGQATPMTYISPKSGRQFVLIAAGGSRTLASPTGDGLEAYALPKK